MDIVSGMYASVVLYDTVIAETVDLTFFHQ